MGSDNKDCGREMVDEVGRIAQTIEPSISHAEATNVTAKVALAPDYLWVALGVPYEQAFVEQFTPALCNVGVIKTSGGLFNFLSGSRPRAPLWMQHAGLEWAWRIRLEPGRLFWRYLTTNPRALYLLLNRGRSTDISGKHNP